MTTDQRVLIIIPAMNEEESIGKVIAEVRAELPWVDILVVNDGSTDSTASFSASPWSRRKRRTSSSVSEDLPAPPTPVMPTTGERSRWR